MNYLLFVEKKDFELIQITLNDYPIPGIDFVGINDSVVLPPHLLLTTGMFADVKMKIEIKSFFKSIGYTGKFKLLKCLVHNQDLDDFELIPPY